MIFNERTFPFGPLTKWNTFEKDFNDISQTLSEFFKEASKTENQFNSYGTFPKVDITQDESKIEIEADIAGYSIGDISIDVTEHTLTISGEKKNQGNEKTQKYLLKELKRSSFKRTFTFGDKFQMDEITSQFKDGLLFIQIPLVKKTQPKSRKIEIK